jgi:hypothetical protein
MLLSAIGFALGGVVWLFLPETLNRKAAPATQPVPA